VYFQHSSEIWAGYPELVAGVLMADGVGGDVSVGTEKYNAIAASRLEGGTEAELPEIQAWRRTFSKMGLKPTQYRCASEQLLRRFRKEGSLPKINPLIDLCNSLSLAFAIPIAVFDLTKVTDYVEVRHAAGDEVYETFAGDVENPEPREVVFADGAGRAHARRWTNRQSGYSAVRDTTRSVLIVAEAMHDSAFSDMENLTAAIADELAAGWSVTAKPAILSQSAPRFEFAL
jgi:DNA/RNA-binding domain of Phe-tRNA-synthetase-like protein